jgi:hypothetical protein
MRERDMRLRVERFLQSRLRSMLLPATMGLGLAVGGCDSDGLNTDDGGDKEDVVATDTAPTTDAAPIPVPVYSVAVPRDAGPELPIAQPEYMAPIKEDAGMVLRYMAQMPDAGRDAGEMVALYLAQIPDPQT